MLILSPADERERESASPLADLETPRDLRARRAFNV